jgi:hypothetical protein
MFYKTAFDTYEVVILLNIHLDDDSIMEAIKWGSIVGKILMKDITKEICFKDALHISQ